MVDRQRREAIFANVIRQVSKAEQLLLVAVCGTNHSKAVWEAYSSVGYNCIDLANNYFLQFGTV